MINTINILGKLTTSWIIGLSVGGAILLGFFGQCVTLDHDSASY